MIKTSGRTAALWAIIAGATFATAMPAFSQAPTDAQRSAIRSACRSDYMAHCSSVPPGGMASLQCLQKNMSSLSSGCQSAVRAVEPAAEAEPKAEAKPESKPEAKPESAPAAASAPPAEKPAAAAAPKAAAAAPSKKPSSAQVAAVRSACRSDYMAHCSSADGRRRGAELPEAEQVEPLGGLPAGGQCRERWRRIGRRYSRAGGGRQCGSRWRRNRGCRRSPGGGADDAAADATARGVVRAEVGMRRRRPLTMRQCAARWWPHRRVPGVAGCLAVAGVP
jgi:hypothetical protein